MGTANMGMAVMGTVSTGMDKTWIVITDTDHIMAYMPITIITTVAITPQIIWPTQFIPLPTYTLLLSTINQRMSIRWRAITTAPILTTAPKQNMHSAVNTHRTNRQANRATTLTDNRNP